MFGDKSRRHIIIRYIYKKRGHLIICPRGIAKHHCPHIIINVHVIRAHFFHILWTAENIGDFQRQVKKQMSKL